MANKNKKNEIITDLTKLSDAQKEQVKTIRKEGGEVEVTKCRFCGKFLIRDKSVEQEAGDLCEKLHETYTNEALMAHRATLTVAKPPEGWIKVAELHKICEANDIPVNRMVVAIGRDRGLSDPIVERLRPVYVGNARWVDGWAATVEGLATIRGAKLTKSEKAQAEIAELEDAVS
jgi:hypothetical protein